MAQTKPQRPTRVKFSDAKLLEAYAKLKFGRTEDKNLSKSIEDAMKELLANPLSGVRIPNQVWPKKYVIYYGINNLWKYNLAGGWRLVYTIIGSEVEILAVLLEWFPHKEYEKRFKYNVG